MTLLFLLLLVPWAARSESDPGATNQSFLARLPKPTLGGYYKNLLSFTDVRENYRNLGLTPVAIAVEDYQRLRLKSDYAPWEDLDFQVHYEVRTTWGDLTRIQTRLDELNLPSLPGLTAVVGPEERPRFLDLEKTPVEEPSFRLTHELDRLRARWHDHAFDVSVGRQAVSWGPGLIWNPMDLFSGFAPTEIDRDEKLGVDVARLTWSPAFGRSLDLIAEPLDDEDGPYHLDPEDSSLALRGTLPVGEYDLAAVGGQIAGDQVAGADFSGYLGNAGFRGEAVYTWVKEAEDRNYFRTMLSLDYAFPTRWNPYLAAEYFYNGLGTADPDQYLSRLTSVSVQRAFQRGNAYNVGRHYLGVVGRLQPNALLSLQAITLWNLTDYSVREYATAVWSVTENLEFQVGANVGLGPLGTEFAGFSEDQIGIDFRLPNLAFAFLKFYF